MRLVSKISVKESNKKIRLAHSDSKKKLTTCTDVSLQPNVFHWNDLKRAPLILQTWTMVNHHHDSRSLAYVFCE